jgi:hypothetical protein
MAADAGSSNKTAAPSPVSPCILEIKLNRSLPEIAKSSARKLRPARTVCGGKSDAIRSTGGEW